MASRRLMLHVTLKVTLEQSRRAATPRRYVYTVGACESPAAGDAVV